MTPAKPAPLREEIARELVSAINMALAGTGAVGRVDAQHQGVTYYVDRVLALWADDGLAERLEACQRLRENPAQGANVEFFAVPEDLLRLAASRLRHQTEGAGK